MEVYVMQWRVIMATKLTLRIDERLITGAKVYARRSGRSVSQLVADFFALLASKMEKEAFEATPGVKSLRGVFRGKRLKNDEYRRHLEDKYL